MGRIADMLAERNRRGLYLCTGIDPRKDHVDHIASLTEWRSPDQMYINYSRDVMEAAEPVSAMVKAQHAHWARRPDALRALLRMSPGLKDILKVLDGKFNDIGDTCDDWADFAEYLGAHAVTMNPFMGFEDVIVPFAKRNIGCFILCSTTNKGSQDLQAQALKSGLRVDEYVAQSVQTLVDENLDYDLGLVVGCTRPEDLERISEFARTVPFLIPGLGTQGGASDAVVNAMRSHRAPWAVNVSRGIAQASERPATRVEWKASVASAAQRYREELAH